MKKYPEYEFEQETDMDCKIKYENNFRIGKKSLIFFMKKAERTPIVSDAMLTEIKSALRFILKYVLKSNLQSLFKSIFNLRLSGEEITRKVVIAVGNNSWLMFLV